MLSMFKDKKGFDVLFNKSTRNSSLLSMSTSSVSDVPVIKESLPHFTSSAANSLLLHHNDKLESETLTINNDYIIKNNNVECNDHASVTLTQRCQRCWRNFLVVEEEPLNDAVNRNSNNNTRNINNEKHAAFDKSTHAQYNVLDFTCCVCDHTICPRCRVYNSHNNISTNETMKCKTWRCCSCVKPMTLMRLFDDTHYGSELVVRVIDYCDVRAARIMRSFFHSAARVLASQRNKRQQRSIREDGDGLINTNNNSPEREGSLIRTSYAIAWLEQWKCQNAQVINTHVQSKENVYNSKNINVETEYEEEEYEEENVLLENEINSGYLHMQDEPCEEISGKADTFTINETETHYFTDDDHHLREQEQQQEEQVQPIYDNAMQGNSNSESSTNKTGLKLRERSANEVNVLDCKSQWCEKEKQEKLTAAELNELTSNDNENINNTENEQGITTNTVIEKERPYEQETTAAADQHKLENEEVCKCDKDVTVNSRSSSSSSSPALFMKHTSPTTEIDSQKQTQTQVKANGFMRCEPVRLSLLAECDNNSKNNINIRTDKTNTNSNYNDDIDDDKSIEENVDDDRSCSPPPRFPPFSEVVNECLKVTEVEVNIHKTKSRKRFAQNDEQRCQLDNDKNNNNKSKRNFSSRRRSSANTNSLHNAHKHQRKSKSYRTSPSANHASFQDGKNVNNNNNSDNTYYYSYNSNDENDDYSFVSLSPESSFDEPIACDDNENNSYGKTENEEDDVISYSDEHVAEHTCNDKSKSENRNNSLKNESEKRYNHVSSPHTTLRSSKSNRPFKQLRKSKSHSFKKSYNNINKKQVHQREAGLSESSRHDKYNSGDYKAVKEGNNGMCTSHTNNKIRKESLVSKPGTNNTEEESLHKNIFDGAKHEKHDVAESHREQTASTSTCASPSHKTSSKITNRRSVTARHSNHPDHIAGGNNMKTNHVLTYHTPVKGSLLNSVTRLTEAHRRTSHRHERHQGRRCSSSASSMISTSSSSWLLSQKEKKFSNININKKSKEHFLERATPKSARQHPYEVHNQAYLQEQQLQKEIEAKCVSTIESTSNGNEPAFQVSKQKLSIIQTPKTFTHNERQIGNSNKLYKRTASYAHFTRKPSSLTTLLPNENNKNSNSRSNNNNKLKRTHSALPFTSASMYCHPYSQLELSQNVKDTHQSSETKQENSLAEFHLECTPGKDKNNHVVLHSHTCTVTPLRQFSRTSSTRTRSSKTAMQPSTPQFTNQTRFAPLLDNSLHNKNTTMNTHNAYFLRQPQSSRFALSRLQKTTREVESSSSVISVNSKVSNTMMENRKKDKRIDSSASTDGVNVIHNKTGNLFSRSHTATSIPSRSGWEHNSTRSSSVTNKNGRVVNANNRTAGTTSARLNNFRNNKMLQQRSLQQHREAISSTSLSSGVHRLYRSHSAITSLTGKINENNNNTINKKDTTLHTSVKQAQRNITHHNESNLSSINGIVIDKENKCNNDNVKVTGNARLRRLASSSSSALAFTQHPETLAKVNVDNAKDKTSASLLFTVTSHDNEVNTHANRVVPFTRKLENLKRSCSSRHALSSRPIFTRHDSTHAPVRMNAVSARLHDTETIKNTNTKSVTVTPTKVDTSVDNISGSVKMMVSNVHKLNNKANDVIATPSRNLISSIKSNNTFYRTSSRTLLTQRTHNMKEDNATVCNLQQQQEVNDVTNINKKGKIPLISPLLTVTRKNATSARGTAKVNADKTLFSSRNDSSNNNNNSSVNSTTSTNQNKIKNNKNQLVKRTLQRSKLPTARSANANKNIKSNATNATCTSSSTSSTSSFSKSGSTTLTLSSFEPLSSRQHSASLLSSQNKLTSLNVTGRRSGTRPVLNSAASTPRNMSNTDNYGINSDNVCNSINGNDTATNVNLTERLTNSENEVNM